MAHIGKKLGLGPIGVFGMFAGAHQFMLARSQFCNDRLRASSTAAIGSPIAKAEPKNNCMTSNLEPTSPSIKLIGPNPNQVATVAMIAILIVDKAVPSAPRRNA